MAKNRKARTAKRPLKGVGKSALIDATMERALGLESRARTLGLLMSGAHDLDLQKEDYWGISAHFDQLAQDAREIQNNLLILTGNEDEIEK